MMTERNEPLPIMDRFVDPSDISARLSELRRRRVTRSAVHLAAISRLRAEAHAAANLFRDFYVGTSEEGTEPLRRELSGARSALARWALMQAHGEFRTVDLARVENVGDWDATSEVEKDIATLAQSLRQAGNGGEIIDRHHNTAKRRIMIDPTLVSAQGLVAVRRKRLMVVTGPSQVRFVDRRHAADAPPRVFEATSRTEIDKVSEFVLDLRMMRRMSQKAAREIEQAIKGDAPTEITNHGRDLVSPRMIEAAIDARVRHPMLTPAVTTYYADRKFSNVHEVEPTAEVETELADA